MYIYIYIYSSNLWESNHRDGPTGHKNYHLAQQQHKEHVSCVAKIFVIKMYSQAKFEEIMKF